MDTRLPRVCWAVVDYDHHLIIVRYGKEFSDGYSTDDYIVPTTGFEASRAAWKAFNEWQYGPCPYPIESA